MWQEEKNSVCANWNNTALYGCVLQPAEATQWKISQFQNSWSLLLSWIYQKFNWVFEEHYLTEKYYKLIQKEDNHKVKNNHSTME